MILPNETASGTGQRRQLEGSLAVGIAAAAGVPIEVKMEFGEVTLVTAVPCAVFQNSDGTFAVFTAPPAPSSPITGPHA